MNINNIKLVLWDVDGTIFDFSEAQEHSIRACFSKFNLGECTDEMLDNYDQINHKYWKALERGEITKPQVLVQRFYEFFNMYGIDTSVVEAFNDEYQIRLGDTTCVFPGSIETIKAFKERNILQFIVTNGTKIAQDRKLHNTGIDELVDAVFISEIVGHEKPSPLFFEPVLSEARKRIPDISLDEIMIIGDALSSDIQLGNNVGIKTCWFRRGQTEDTDLRVDMSIEAFEDLVIQGTVLVYQGPSPVQK